MDQHLRPFGLATRIARGIVPLTLVGLLGACSGAGTGDAFGGPNNGSNNTADSGDGAGNSTPKPLGEAETIARLTDIGIKNRTFYVSANDGNDTNNGLTVDKAFQTLERAIAAVGPGDTLELRAGIYRPKPMPLNSDERENGFYLRKGGTAQSRIKMKPYNGEKAILENGDRDLVFYIWADAGYWIIQDLEIRGSGPNGYTIKIDGHHINLVNNNIHGSRLDTIKLVQTSDDVVIYGNEIHSPHPDADPNAQGIDIVGGDRTWVAHNYVHDFKSIALYAKGNARNTIFENNRVENIAERGIMLGQSTDSWLLEADENGQMYESYDGIIRNNVIINTDSACLATASSINVKIYNNTCYNVAKLRHGAIFVSNESMVEQQGRNIEIKNNIIVGSSRPVVKIGPNAMSDISTLHIDNNVYWNGGAPVTFLSEDHSLFNVPIDNWRAAMNKDRASIVADPKFASLTTLMLELDSPAIDAGAATDVVTMDYNHNPRPADARIDIGAHEMK